MPRTAQEVFDESCCTFGWDFDIQSDALVGWLGEGMIDPLLQVIEETSQTDDFEEFLIDNYDDPKANGRDAEETDWRETGF